MKTNFRFTETRKYERDGNYMIAHGWTQSTGQSGAFVYTPPNGWAYDMRYTDEFDHMGSHGGCPSCHMVLVHLISIDPAASEGIPTAAYIWMAVLVGLYVMLK